LGKPLCPNCGDNDLVVLDEIDGILPDGGPRIVSGTVRSAENTSGGDTCA